MKIREMPLRELISLLKLINKRGEYEIYFSSERGKVRLIIEDKIIFVK